MTGPRPRSLRGIDADYVHSNRVIVRVGLSAVNAMWFLTIYNLSTGGNPFGDRIADRSIFFGSVVATVLFLIFVRSRSARLGIAIAVWSVLFALWNGLAHQLWIYLIFWLVISGCAVTCLWHLRLMEKFRKEYGEKWTPYEIKPGDIFTVRDGDAFTVVKVLTADAERVHVRQYALRYPERPWTVKSSILQERRPSGDTRAFAHLPLDFSEFVRWEPSLMRNEPVSVEELKTMDVWREMQGHKTNKQLED